MKVGNEILTFSNIDIEKKIAALKLLSFLKDVDIEKILVSNKISFNEEKPINIHQSLV